MNVKDEIQVKHCENLGCDVVLQSSNGVTCCLSSHLCKNGDCDDRQPDTQPSDLP